MLLPTHSLLPLLLLAVSPFLAVQVEATAEEASPFLAEANRLLAQGYYSDAAKAFGEALGTSLFCPETPTRCIEGGRGGEKEKEKEATAELAFVLLRPSVSSLHPFTS